MRYAMRLDDASAHSARSVAWVSALYVSGASSDELPQALRSICAQLFFAIAINCFPSKVYGQMEYILSCAKVMTIVIISEYLPAWMKLI